MQFLIDEDLPRSTGKLLQRYGHQATDVRDIGLRGQKICKLLPMPKEKVCV